MTDETTGAVQEEGGPGALPTDISTTDQLAAIGTYIKVLTGIEKALRAGATDEMGKTHTEKVGAYLPDGTKMASVTRSDGKRGARVTDPAEAVRWCRAKYPSEMVSAINPAFLKKLTDAAAKGEVGDPGVDPRDGELLGFIEVYRGSPYVTITTEKAGVDRMTALAQGFAAMIEGPR